VFNTFNQPGGEKRRYITYICIRNYGDALVQAAMISNLMGDHLKDIVVICKKSTSFIFAARDITCLHLPEKFYNPIEVIKFLYFLYKRKSYVYCFFGDIRERLISLFLIRGKVFIPKWPKENYLNKILRMKGPLFHATSKSLENFNLYADFKELIIFSKLNTGYIIPKETLNNCPNSSFSKVTATVEVEHRISLQLMGSIREKIIPESIILLLVNKLLSLNYGLNFIGDKVQIDQLKRLLNLKLCKDISYCTSFLEGESAIASSVAFIGIDSYWAHYAVLESKPSFIFTGGIPERAIYPEHTATFATGTACDFFPCNNFSFCFNGESAPLSCFGVGNNKLIDFEINKFLETLK